MATLKSKIAAGSRSSQSACSTAGIGLSSRASAIADAGVDLMRPYGRFVGVVEADDDSLSPALTIEEETAAIVASELEGSLPALPSDEHISLANVTDGPSGGSMSVHQSLRLALDATSFASESSRSARVMGKEKSGTALTITVTEVGGMIERTTDPLMALVSLKGYGATPAL
eukprot:1428795-Prymnesium_polylepis.1